MFFAIKEILETLLTGFILAILPGLEEGSDIYQRTFELLKNVSKQTGDDYFFTCLWSAMLFSSAIRFPAIQYILTHFDRKKTMEDQLYLIGNSIDTMINSICNCLQDTNSLVQRSILDFILQCLPMHNNQVTRDDKIKLIKIAIHLVLRRDMSLNRRIYAWFLGQDSNSNPIVLPKSVRLELQMQITEQELDKSQNENMNSNIYFKTYSHALLITSIKSLLARGDHSSASSILMEETQTIAIKMLKIISSLSEKQEIGQFIIEEVLLDLLLYVFKECETLNESSSITASKEKTEIVKATCNFIFQSLQLNFIWDFCASKFEEVCHDVNYNETKAVTPSLLCDLYNFILDPMKISKVFKCTKFIRNYLTSKVKRLTRF